MSLSGVTDRAGSLIRIGDNRYGSVQDYDDEAKKRAIETARKGDTVTIAINTNK